MGRYGGGHILSKRISLKRNVIALQEFEQVYSKAAVLAITPRDLSLDSENPNIQDDWKEIPYYSFFSYSCLVKIIVKK